jgi:hypothetical protein
LAGVAAAIPLAAQATDTSSGGILGYATSGQVSSDVAAGAVTSRCSDTSTGNQAVGCGTVASEGAAGGEAFLQETITSGDGTTYVRTVIYETSGEGIITMENFVEMGGAGGLRGRQQQTDGAFSLNSSLNTGTFNTSTADGVDITQSLSDGDLSQNDFWFHENASDLGGTNANFIGRDVALSQTVGNATDGTERFVKVVHEGNSVPTFSFTANGTNFSSTTATADIAVTWVGTNLGSTFGLEDTLANAGLSTEAGTGNDSLASPGFAGTSPVTALGFGWDSNLNFHGVQPSFP